jgi:hypothetical protein
MKILLKDNRTVIILIFLTNDNFQKQSLKLEFYYKK